MDIDKRLDELRERYKSYIRYCNKVERTKPYSPGEQDFNATIQLNIIDAVETLYMLISVQHCDFENRLQELEKLHGGVLAASTHKLDEPAIDKSEIDKSAEDECSPATIHYPSKADNWIPEVM